jgi:hypothetical protein
MGGTVGGKGAVKLNQNKRHLTGVEFEEAAARFGRRLKKK